MRMSGFCKEKEIKKICSDLSCADRMTNVRVMVAAGPKWKRQTGGTFTPICLCACWLGLFVLSTALAVTTIRSAAVALSVQVRCSGRGEAGNRNGINLEEVEVLETDPW